MSTLELLWKTPSGNMISDVLQQGDCNAPATYQATYNESYLLSIHRDFYGCISDDIIIYSDRLQVHVEHIKLALEILEKEKFYLSEGKLDFLCEKIKILGKDHQQ